MLNLWDIKVGERQRGYLHKLLLINKKIWIYQSPPIHPWWWERLKSEEGDNRGQDGRMASLTQWTWIWASSGRWWRTGKPGVLESVGSQTVRHDWVTDQKQPKFIFPPFSCHWFRPLSPGPLPCDLWPLATPRHQHPFNSTAWVSSPNTESPLTASLWWIPATLRLDLECLSGPTSRKKGA